MRERLEELNNYKFSDSEWDRFFNEAIANPNDKIEDKTRKIQEDFVQVLKRDDALTKTHVEEYSGDWVLQDEVRGIRLVVMRLVFH